MLDSFETQAEHEDRSVEGLRVIAAAHQVIMAWHPIVYMMRDQYGCVLQVMPLLDALDNLERALAKLAES